MEGKTVTSTAIDNHTYKIFPNDLNTNNTVFGGLVMGMLDRITLVVAEKHSEQVCVTASVDALHFLSPAHLGEILVFKAAINRSWHASMEIGIKVLAENYKTKESRHVVSAYFTFVALNDKGRPTLVPKVIAESKLEKRRFEEADIRRQNRLKMAQENKERRLI